MTKLRISTLDIFGFISILSGVVGISKTPLRGMLSASVLASPWGIFVFFFSLLPLLYIFAGLSISPIFQRALASIGGKRIGRALPPVCTLLLWVVIVINIPAIFFFSIGITQFIFSGSIVSRISALLYFFYLLPLPVILLICLSRNSILQIIFNEELDTTPKKEVSIRRHFVTGISFMGVVYILSPIILFAMCIGGAVFMLAHDDKAMRNAIDQRDVDYCASIDFERGGYLGRFFDWTRLRTFSDLLRQHKETLFEECWKRMAFATLDPQYCERLKDVADDAVVKRCTEETRRRMPTSTEPSPYCLVDPQVNEIGREIFPINVEKYGTIGYLGELFTADDCGKERVSKIFGVKGDEYTLWPDIGLRGSPSAELLPMLFEIGFRPGSTCEGMAIVSECTHWSLEKSVSVQSILRLKPFAGEIQSSGCIQCG